MTFHKTGGNMTGAASAQTLNDYIKRKYPEETNKKLTFDEWFLGYLGKPFEDWDFNLQENDMRNAWKAAQENV